MSEQTICYVCGGRTYEHAPRCHLRATLVDAIDRAPRGDWLTMSEAERAAMRIHELLQRRGFIITREPQ